MPILPKPVPAAISNFSPLWHQHLSGYDSHTKILPTNMFYSASSPVKVEKVPVLEPGYVCRFEEFCQNYIDEKEELAETKSFLFPGSAHKAFLAERVF